MVAFASTADAVRCAVAMQQAAAQQRGERLAIRVGMNVGEVLQQKTGSGYFGTPVVVARRLCDQAAAGQILCSQAVSLLLVGRAAFAFRELGAVELKGIAEKVGVYEVEYEAEPAAGLFVQAPFVGRRSEMARLEARLEQARSGNGAVVMVVGEPGIGKTRTLEEFSAHARQQGARVVWGRCYEGEGAPPFGPFAEAVTDYAKALPPEELEKDLASYGPALSVLAPLLRSWLPDLPAPVPLQPDEERWRLLDAVTQFFLAASQRAPIVLVLDDLHWSDAGTVAMMRHTARFAARGRILIVGAYRDVELDRQHPLADALGALRREATYERIVLHGLGEGEVSELLQAIASQEVPAVLVRALHAETEGNPFFLREVLLHLAEEGKLYRSEGRWRSDYSVEELGIPEGVREVIGRRLSRLSKEANRLLAAASGSAGAFHLGVAAGAAALEENVALDALDEALGAQLLRATGDPEVYDFTHALIRHTLYGELSPARQVRLHRRLAEEMERVYTDRAEHAGEIARQWHRSSAIQGAERGVPHCLTAADAAEKAAAYEEAAGFLTMALDLLPEDDARRARLLARRGLALAWTLRPEDAVTVASEAGELLAVAEGHDPAADYLAEAANAVSSANLSPLAWRLSSQGLRHIGARRDLTWALLMHFDLLRRMAEDRELPGIPLVAPESEEMHQVALRSPEWLRRAPDEFAVERIAKPRSRAEVLALPYCSPMRLGFEAGEYRRAVSEATEFVARALAHGRLASAALGCGLCARPQLALGELAEADQWHARGVELAERIGNPPFIVVQLAGAPFDRVRVRGEGFAEYLASVQALRGRPSPENRWVYAALLAAGAYLAAEGGLRELALRLAGAALPALERAPGWEWNYLFVMFWTVAACWELDYAKHAALLERNLRTKSLSCDFRSVNTDARLALALTCALLGRFDEATHWFAEARVVLEEQGARPLRAITDFEEARMYIRRGAAGDRERALALLDAARGPFESIGMPGWLRRVEELRQQLAR
jgi:hypothetical protein